MSNKTILIVEDDWDILRANRMALELEGYHVLEAETLAKARAIAGEYPIDLILLDVLLPDGSGLDYCENLRGHSGVRILFLSALNTRQDILAGLRAGGDDYISKPYDMEELLLRVRALLRRDPIFADQNVRQYGPLTMDHSARRALLNGEDLLLETKEYAILEALAERCGGCLSAKELYTLVWGMEPGEDVRTVRVRVSGLRHKLREHTQLLDIENDRGQGYRLVERSRDGSITET